MWHYATRTHRQSQIQTKGGTQVRHYTVTVLRHYWLPTPVERNGWDEYVSYCQAVNTSVPHGESLADFDVKTDPLCVDCAVVKHMADEASN